MRVALVSYRLGGTDGVAVEAAKWAGALRALGHQVRTVAGAGRADVLVPGLGADDASGPAPAALSTALEGCALVVVENVASLPLNEAARDALEAALAGRPALFHHHDLPWQRPALANRRGPRAAPGWVHVTINERSRAELAARGVPATTLYNHFACDPPRGRRAATRAALQVGDETLALLPSRALARKGVGAALALAGDLGATLWLRGPAEDGYGAELERLVAASPARVVRGPVGSIHDAYAACDLVVVSSTWEGFGNPVVESITHARPLAVAPYPVLAELRALGLDLVDLADRAGVAHAVRTGDGARLAHNRAVVGQHLDLRDLPARLAPLVAATGAR
ncbi:MAG: glycosyltransferase [Acidimicrobiales bacterium]